MKKYILLSIMMYAYAVSSFGQAIGSWKAYPALQISTDNIPVNNKIYSLCNGNLFCYNTENSEIYVYDRINGLHDTQIKFIKYCEAVKKLILIYENGNIDIVYSDDEVVNLKQIKDKNYASLTINNITIVEKIAYICTNFGIIELNLEKEEFTATYNLDLDVYCCIKYDNAIYASTKGGFYKGDYDLNLLDKGNWIRLNGYIFTEMLFFQDNIMCLNKSTGIYKIEPSTLTTTLFESGKFNYMSNHNNVMVINNENKFIIYSSLTEKKEFNQSNTFNKVNYNKGIYWASQGINGLQPYSIDENEFIPLLSPIQPNSPIRDYFCNMHYDGNRLLIAGGDLNYNGVVREATIMYYEDDTWYNFIENNVAEQAGIPYYRDINSIAQDPKDPTHHFVSAPRLGLFEYKDLKFVKRYDETNSDLRKIEGTTYAVACSALNYDNNGNLWIINNEVDTVLVILKSDNTWTKLYYPEIEKMPTCNYFVTFDRKGNVWFNSQRMDTRGIFFLDYNGTLEDTSDDIHMLRQEIINQDGIKYTPDNFYCIVEDHNGQMWIGTDVGPFIITNPDNFIDEDFTYTQVKIARNDGTEYADYLLNGVSVTTIAVDAANRKWIGTASNGIYLVSADGQEMIQHFTTENSPLISDEIQSIVVSPQTGEVMIGTEKGLVSYMSDANTPEEILDKNNISVYPNPVTPDYNGLIAVSGLTENAEVKVTTITGQLVYMGYSQGGIFTWNGRNKSGRRVSSGIYNVIATNAEGKKAVVARITFIH